MDFAAAVGWGVPIYLSVILSEGSLCAVLSPKQLHSENEPGGAVLQGPPRHVGAMRQHPTFLPEATHLCLPPPHWSGDMHILRSGGDSLAYECLGNLPSHFHSLAAGT